MAAAGLGLLALVAGTAGGIAALTSEDTRVVTAVGRGKPVAQPPATKAPAQPPTGQAGLGNGVVGQARPEGEADQTRPAPAAADPTTTRPPRTGTAEPGLAGGAAVANGVGDVAPAEPPAVAAPARPAVRIKRISRTTAVPFRVTRVVDRSLPLGSRVVRAPGALGVRVMRYEVTFAGNQVTSRRLLGSTVTREPTNRVIAIGTRKSAVRPPAGQPTITKPPTRKPADRPSDDDRDDADHSDDGKNGDGRNDDGKNGDDRNGDDRNGNDRHDDWPDDHSPSDDWPDDDSHGDEPGNDDDTDSGDDADGDDWDCWLFDCVRQDRDIECADGSEFADELRMPDPSGIDELELKLPCDDGWDGVAGAKK